MKPYYNESINRKVQLKIPLVVVGSINNSFIVSLSQSKRINFEYMNKTYDIEMTKSEIHFMMEHSNDKSRTRSLLGY